MDRETDFIEVEGCGCVSDAAVFGLYSSVKYAKLPMSVEIGKLTDELTPGITKLAESPKGEGHDQWLTGVIVQFCLTFTNKAWVEAERYHWLDFVSSQSTMHRMVRFSIEDQYCQHVDKRIIKIIQEKIDAYNEAVENGAEDFELNEKYLDILYSNPAGFKLTARMTTNYRQLKTIYSQRKNHRLPEWREFCEWIRDKLPNSYLITGV